MILDSLHSTALYKSIHPRFATAFDYFLANPNQQDGVYEIAGRDIYITYTSGALRQPCEAMLEAHDRYIDIQIVLSGSETYGFAPRGALKTVSGESDPDRDLVFYTDPIKNMVPVHAGQFVIFFPSDAHAPLLGHGMIRKAIIKVLL